VPARELIRERSRRAIERAKRQSFGIIPLQPPFERVVKLRRGNGRQYPTVMRVTHPSSFIGVMNMWAPEKPMVE